MDLILLPADVYLVFNKSIINDFDKKILISFYEPIVGHLAISLYLTLFNDLEGKQMSREHTHHHLMSILKTPLKDVLKARNSLESVGLIKTYVKKSNVNNYIYEIYSPLTPREFFNHPILNVTLYNNIGGFEYDYLKEQYKVIKLDLKEYEDITASIDEVYTSVNITGVDAIDRNTTDINTKDQVDFDLIISAIPKSLINEKAFNKKTRELINQLAFIYKIDSLKMIELIRSSLNEFGMIDKNELRIIARKSYQYNNNALPTMVYRSQPEYLKTPVGDNSLNGKLIQMFESLTPFDFLAKKNGGVKPAKNECKIIESLMVDFELQPAVINVLLDYILRKNNNRLSVGYVEAIASQWKRANLKNASDAMDFAIKENKRLERKIPDNKVVSKEPVWFNKNIEEATISESEKEELDKLLKEFK